MAEINHLLRQIEELQKNIGTFIDLSFANDEKKLREWIEKTVNHLEPHCWKHTGCENRNCPAYENECGRCWLIAGTMCNGEVQGRLAQKFASCRQCDFFQKTVNGGPVEEIRELVIVLIQSLRNKQADLRQALAEVKTLSGFLPICAACKKIRDDAGFWNQLEAYISRHSEAQFTHSICPDCCRRLYPGFDLGKNDE